MGWADANSPALKAPISRPAHRRAKWFPSTLQSLPEGHPAQVVRWLWWGCRDPVSRRRPVPVPEHADVGDDQELALGDLTRDRRRSRASRFCVDITHLHKWCISRITVWLRYSPVFATPGIFYNRPQVPFPLPKNVLRRLGFDTLASP